MICHTPEHLDDFLNLCTDCRSVQDEVLHDILQSAASSRLGRKYGFAEIRDYTAFSKTVPPLAWEDIKGYTEIMAKGEQDQLFQGKTEYFIYTSGTTSAIKMIPESEQGKEAKSVTTGLRLQAMKRYAPDVMGRKILPLVNNAVEDYTEAGIACGSASGLTLAHAPKSAQAMLAFPVELLEIGYRDVLDYVIMRFAVEADIGAIFGNNAGRIEQLCLRAEKEAERIIADISQGTISYRDEIPQHIYEALRKKCRPNPERAEVLEASLNKQGRFLPAEYWPKLQVLACWLSGSVGRYVNSARQLFGENTYLFDVGYGAAEGKFNIPLTPENAAGPLTIHAAFYEFMPIDGSDVLLRAHELKQGECYKLFVTSYSGLYRYPMNDVVKVTGFTGNTPEIVFEYKAGEILNLCGEKVAASSLSPLLSGVLGEDLVHWCIVPDSDAKCYCFCLEFSTVPEDPGQAATEYAELLEHALMQEHLIYPIFRRQNLLYSARVALMAPGWQEALYNETDTTGRSRAQVKLPLIYGNIPSPEQIMAKSG